MRRARPDLQILRRLSERRRNVCHVARRGEAVGPTVGRGDIPGVGDRLMPGCSVRRVESGRIPLGREWMVVRSDDGWTCAFVPEEVDWTAELVRAIREGVATLPVPAQRVG